MSAVQCPYCKHVRCPYCKDVRCPYCNLTFSAFQDFRRHILTDCLKTTSSVDPRRLANSTANGGSDDDDHLDGNHDVDSGPFVCPYCGKRYYAKKSLSHHVSLNHRGLVNEAAPIGQAVLEQPIDLTTAATKTTTAIRNISCKYCNYFFFSEVSLENHVDHRHEAEAKAVEEYYESGRTEAEREARRRKKFPKFRRDSKRLDHVSKLIWRKLLSEDFLHSLDGERQATEREVEKDFLSYVLSDEAQVDWKNAFYVTGPPGFAQKLLRSGQIKKLLPSTCQSFRDLMCNVYGPAHARQVWEEIAGTARNQWREYCHIVLENHPEDIRSIESRYYGNDRVKFLRMKSFMGFVYSILYIAGRISYGNLRTRLSHSGPYYLSEPQKWTVVERARAMDVRNEKGPTLQPPPFPQGYFELGRCLGRD